jgi:hypothetical protein
MFSRLFGVLFGWISLLQQTHTPVQCRILRLVELDQAWLLPLELD